MSGNFSQTFEKALAEVERAGSHPKYSIGQPLWAVGGHDQHCYIVVGIHRPMFGAWTYDVVLETDPTGPIYPGIESYFTDEAPPTPAALHPEHPGNIYFTSDSTPLKCIRHWSDR